MNHLQINAIKEFLAKEFSTIQFMKTEKILYCGEVVGHVAVFEYYDLNSHDYVDVAVSFCQSSLQIWESYYDLAVKYEHNDEIARLESLLSKLSDVEYSDILILDQIVTKDSIRSFLLISDEELDELLMEEDVNWDDLEDIDFDYGLYDENDFECI